MSDVVARLASQLFGGDIPVRIQAVDGSVIGPPDAKSTVVLRTDDAVRHLVRAPGELGFARAYVSGALDIEGDIWALVDLQHQLPDVSVQPVDLFRFLRLLGLEAVLHKPAIPVEEVRPAGPLRRPGNRRHSKSADAAAISHHYDVSNAFYRLVLGSSWTYSCAVFEAADDTLARAQANKYELICRKLDLRPGMRLLDVGCGWGGMVLHAAQHHGVEAVGITISSEQAALARERVEQTGLTDKIDIRLQDYRDLADGPFEAISSIGMFEHVGDRQQREYFTILKSLLADEGRLLNHQIGRTPAVSPSRGKSGNGRGAAHTSARRRERTHVHRRGFVHRYVFPDGALHEIGDLVANMQRTGFEVRHVESLREHYALTLRHWVNNLDNNWDEAVSLVGEGRARVWRLYMAASSSLFKHNRIQLHQVLASNTTNQGTSGMPFRPAWTGSLETDSRQTGSLQTEPLMDLTTEKPSYDLSARSTNSMG